MTTGTGDPALIMDVAPLRLAVLRLARRLRKHSGADLTPSQFSALSTLERHGPLRLGGLAVREQISKSSVTRLVARLEALGHVRRTPDSTDGRSAQIELTDQGSEYLEMSTRRSNVYLTRQVAALTTRERETLLAALPALERLLVVKP